MAKVGLDGHDVGARVVARGLLEAGMEVIYTGIRRTPEQIARIAMEEDVDVVGISILSGAHMALVPKVRSLLDPSVLMVVGGVIPQEDIPELEKFGVSMIFLSGTSVAEIAEHIRSAVTFTEEGNGSSDGR